MIKVIVRYATSAAAALLLSSCSGKPEAPLEGAAPATPVATDPNLLTGAAIDPEFAAVLKGLVAESGGQCLHIVNAQGEDASSKVKVTCAAQAGDSNTVSYTVDPGI